MTTVIVNKEKKEIKVYSDKQYTAQNIETGEINLEDTFHDIKSIKINNDLILFAVGNMAVFQSLSEAWRRDPDFLNTIKDVDDLIEEIGAVLYMYANQPVKQYYDLYVVSKEEVLYLDCGLNVNPEKPVSVISKTHKITGTPQIYGYGSRIFNKPNKLRKLLNKSPSKVFEKINADPNSLTSKEFDTLSINI